MQHNAATHHSQHCLLRLKPPSGTELYHNLENSTCDPLKYIMGTYFINIQYVWENPSEYKGLIIMLKQTQGNLLYLILLEAQRLSGRVLDSRPRGPGFEPHRCHCVVSLSKNKS